MSGFQVPDSSPASQGDDDPAVLPPAAQPGEEERASSPGQEEEGEGEGAQQTGEEAEGKESPEADLFIPQVLHTCRGKLPTAEVLAVFSPRPGGTTTLGDRDGFVMASLNQSIIEV
jgi:hypothetical protein